MLTTTRTTGRVGEPAGRDRRTAGPRSPYAGGLRYAPGLDGIRAAAVGAVLLYHAEIRWLPGGFLGVDLFFVLSGYLITSLLLAEFRRDGRVDLARFWAGRARRLLPAATLVIVVCLVVEAVFSPADFGQSRGDAAASILYVNNWHQIIASRSYFAHFGRPSLLAHFWSLSVEEQFYLVWPLVLIAGLSARRRGLTIAAAIGVAIASAMLMARLYHAGADPSRVYYGTDTRATPLMVGAVVAFAWPFGRMTAGARRSARWLLDLVGLAGLAALALAMVRWHDYDPFLYRGGFALVALAGAAAIVAATHPACHLAGALGARPLRWIGQRSYGIYLWHWPVMALSRPRIDLAWSAWILVPAQLGLTVALAALSYRYVEMPIRRRRVQRRLRAWLDARRPRQRLAALSATTAILTAALMTAALLPAGGSPVPHRLLALSAVSDPAGPLTGAPPRDRPGPERGPVLAVGASVMLAAAAELERRLGARVDAAVGRQPSAIIDRLRAYRDAGALPSRVVVQIGDNGPLWHADAVRLHLVLRNVPQVVLVDVREPTSWEDEVNRQLVQAVRAWPQARIADWRAASANRDLLYDGAHPNGAGAVVYANVVARALARAPAG